MLKDYELIIFDSDGVLVEDGRALPGSAELTNQLLERNKTVIVFSNNSTTHPRIMQDKYSEQGIRSSGIVTSSMLVVSYLKSENINRVYVVGEQGFQDVLEEAQIVVTDKEALAVVVGMDRTLTYEKLAIATRLIREGARFIASNPDKSFPTPRGQEPGAGSMIAALVASTDTDPEIIVGKPSVYGYDKIVEMYGNDKSRTIMIGDRFETDILGALNAGIQGIIVNTGIAASRERPGEWKDYVSVPVVTSLFDLMEK